MEDKLKYIRYMRDKEQVDSEGRVWLPITKMNEDLNMRPGYEGFEHTMSSEVREIKESCREIGASLRSANLGEINIEKGFANIEDIVNIYNYCSFANEGYYDIKTNRCIWSINKNVEDKTPFEMPRELLKQFGLQDILCGNVSVCLYTTDDYINLAKNLLYDSVVSNRKECLRLFSKIPREYPYILGCADTIVDYCQIQLDPDLHAPALRTTEYILRYWSIKYLPSLRKYVLQAHDREDFEILKSVVKVFYPDTNEVYEDTYSILRKYI